MRGKGKYTLPFLLLVALVSLPGAEPGPANSVGCNSGRNWHAEPGWPTYNHPSRAFTGYLADSRNALFEFLFMTYSSWSLHFDGYPSRFDLVVAGDPGMAAKVAPVCTVVPLGVEAESLRDNSTMQQCFFFPYPDRSEEQYGFFGINQAAFLLDDKIAAMLRNYELIIKSDFDVFLLPGIVDFFPPPGRTIFGHQMYVVVSEVSEKIKEVTRAMGLPVRDHWQHNTGMTSYGKFEDLQAIAQVMVDSLRFMLENTFEQRPEGGPELDFSGFPGWCMYVLAMYAQEIGANVVLDKFIIDSRLDAFSDSARPVHELLHVHCQQGADRFNKAQFFMHQYSTVDLSSMDTTITRDCVTNLAVGSFRSAFGSINKRSPKVDDLHTEL